MWRETFDGALDGEGWQDTCNCKDGYAAEMHLGEWDGDFEIDWTMDLDDGVMVQPFMN